jgi:prepilin-type N-terminal cleavage/methylation domain-containing protein
MLICCQKSSLLKPEKANNLRLHRHQITNYMFRKSGFTIIEVLIVVLVIGILSSTAIGTYSGAIKDTAQKSAQDKIQTFFQSCKDRARLRKLNIKILYNEEAKSLINPDSSTSFIQVPELYSKSIPKLIEINKEGKFMINGKTINKLSLLLAIPGGKLATITIDL